jgi:hypothetical protein
MQRIRVYTVSVLSVLAVLAVGAMAQPLVSGDVVGTITDQSGAVVPNATVTENFHLPISESSKLALGLQLFNLFNHANFDQPVGDGRVHNSAVSFVR